MKAKIPLDRLTSDAIVPFKWENTDYILSGAAVGDRGLIVVAMPLPQKFSETVKQLDASQHRYFELSRQRKLVRRTYMELLLLLTVLVLFSTTWLALYLAKLVTRPVVALAEATQEISRGRLDYRVEVSAADEIGDLVRSFNRMAEELETSRRQIDASSHDLGAANIALEQRRQHIETILESIPTGVLSLDANRRITHVNQALDSHVQPFGIGVRGPDRDWRLSAGSISPGNSGRPGASVAARRPYGHDHHATGSGIASLPLQCRRHRGDAATWRPGTGLCSGLRRSVRPAQGPEANRMAGSGAPGRA